MSYDPNDPSSWSRTAGQGFTIGLDLGFANDHSALVVGGVWPQAQSAIGIFDVQQLPLGTPMNDVADLAADLARQYSARIIADLSNNSAFAALLAARLGRNPANHMVAAVITGADSHATMPTPMPVSLGGVRAAVPRWSLSKPELVETVSAEIDNGSLRIGKVGDWEKLRDELTTMEREVRRSGAVAYSAPLGKHDDLVLALALCVFWLSAVWKRGSRASSPCQKSIVGCMDLEFVRRPGSMVRGTYLIDGRTQFHSRHSGISRGLLNSC
jgi:hypothetical protein